MENASKALIIAGAILLAILLISFGIMVFTQAQDSVNNDGLKQEAAQTFNQKFLQYGGKKQPSSQVKALVSLVGATNSSAANSDHQVGLKIGTTGVPKINPDTSLIDDSKTYTIKVSIADSTAVSTCAGWGYKTSVG